MLEADLNEIMNNASSAAAEVEIKRNQDVEALLEPKAQRYLELKGQIDKLKAEQDVIKAELKDYLSTHGAVETLKHKLSVTHRQGATKVKSLKDFVKAGLSEEFLSSKNLITHGFSSVVLNVRAKKVSK